MVQLRQQLAAILDAIAVLQELETDHIAPTARVVALQNVTRPDTVCPSLAAWSGAGATTRPAS